MQTVSGTLAAAILDVESRPVARLLVDWDRDGFGAEGTIDDLSADVKRLVVSRSLTTDLPAGARPFTGFSSATAEVDLARDGEAHAAWYYSAWNTASPLYAKVRKAAPCRVEVGYRTAAGREYVRLLTGRVRALETTSRGRVAKLWVVDNTETLHEQVTLPPVVADDLATANPAKKPGLTGAFLADWVYRQCGWYASPPPRSGCILSATLHGSGWPEVGSLGEFYGANFSPLAFPPATAGFPTAARWVAGVQTSGISSQRTDYATAGSVNVVNGTSFFVEGWFRPAALGGAGNALWHFFANGDASTFVSCWIDTASKLQVNFRRGAADAANRTTGSTGPTVTGAAQWHYVAVYVQFGQPVGTTTKVHFNLDGTWQSPVSVTCTSITSVVNVMNEFRAAQGPAAAFALDYFDGISEAVQVTTEDTGDTPPAHNAGFVPTAVVMAGKNDLLATPVVADEAITVLQQLAAAELAVAGFTEDGLAYYRDRSFFTVAPQTVSQRTLTAQADLKELASGEAVDAVKNHVVVTATPPEVQAASDVWRASGTPAKFTAGQTRSFYLRFAQPVANLNQSVVSHGSGTQSRYNASTARDGNGSQVTNLTFAFSKVTPGGCFVTISNPNGFTVYLCGNTGIGAPAVTPGAPSFVVRGQFVLFDQDTEVAQEASDATSIANYGEQLYPYPTSPFLQDLDAVGSLASDLRDTLKDGPPTLDRVEVVADPRLQLADRATVTDPRGLGVTGQDFHLAEVETELSPDAGLVQRIGTRAV